MAIPPSYDSDLQPAGRSHVPRDWNIYYGRASSSIPGTRTVKGVPITLDCPVFNVDYFDAYAYAKWKHRRLPTEQEWEKAARGPAGNLYPWGNQWDPTKLNAGGDYQSEPPSGYKPAVDGYQLVGAGRCASHGPQPVRRHRHGGNVSEWTDSWDASKTYVVIRGGNYKSTSEQALATVPSRPIRRQSPRRSDSAPPATIRRRSRRGRKPDSARQTAGCCWVRQWNAPRPQINSRQSMGATLRFGNACCSTDEAQASPVSWNTGISTTLLAM